MAKDKKKENLTPGERLQAALVPESEQPYEVPENWCWTYIGYVSSVVTGGTPSKKKPKYYGGSFPFFKPADLDCGRHVIHASEYLSDEGKAVSRIIPEQSTAVCCIGSIGKCGFLEVAGTTNQQINSAIPKFNPLYLYYFCNTNYFVDELRNKATATTISIVNKSKMESCVFPLSPLAEQQRIVDCIESLFSKLDNAKQKAKDALDSFEIRKAAILHKAFIGELTAQWRKEHGMGMDSWKKKRFGEIATIKSNLVKPTDFPNFPHIAPDNIEKKTGILLEYHTISEDGVTSGKHRFYPGQILYSKIRPYLSKVIVVDFDGLCSADMYPIEAKGSTKCLWYYMLSEEFVEQASSAGSRSVLPKINQKELSSLTVNLPMVNDEQEEIVRILDDIFAKEQQAKEIVEAVLEQIDLIKKSILARAFRGELGTNDPREESSVELLKRSFLEIMNNEEVTPKRVIKPKAKEIFMSKTITEVLLKDVRLTPEQLKSETKLSIDDFYAQLIELIYNGKIVENRENGESYLEVANENRQIENHQL